MTRYGALILAFSFLAACSSGDDDSNGGTPCAAGAMQVCTCGDGTTTGMQTCDAATGSFGACLPCTPVGGAGGQGGMGSGGTGGMGSGGTGGMGSGGMSGGMGGMGSGGMGSGGMMSMDEDGGVDDGGTDAEVDAGSDAGDAGGGLGEEGAQNGPCGAGSACDDGLGCYEPDMDLPNFCTAECEDDDDCNALGGAEWTCWVMGGLCRVDCTDNGDDDCPDGFECEDVVGGERCIPID